MLSRKRKTVRKQALYGVLVGVVLCLGIVFLVMRRLTTPQPSLSEGPQSADTLPLNLKEYKVDLDGMLKRRVIRALVVYSKTQYFVVDGAQYGISYEALRAFEGYINQKFPPRRDGLRTRVLLIPVSRDQLLPFIAAGKGDIAVAGLTITPDRRKIVDFTEPTWTGINEIVVTGPGSPNIAKPEDLSGRQVFVRKSSAYWESLQRLNEKLKQKRKAPVRLRAAPETLEDEDLLEMLDAGLFKITVTDAYMADLWSKIHPHIRPHPEIVVKAGDDFGWALRKNSPKLMAALNEFVRSHREGTTFGNILIHRYVDSTEMVQNATAGPEMKKFKRTVELFRKYGDKYDLDYLLMMAQGYQESRLNQAARSKTGAVGVMQVMPATGRAMDVGDIFEIEPNIHAGVKYVRYMESLYFADQPMNNLNKALFSLASYTAGPARVEELRQIAKSRGFDPNVWFGNVESIAAERIGMHTVTYVSNIYKYYVAYRMIQEQEEERHAAWEAMTKAR